MLVPRFFRPLVAIATLTAALSGSSALAQGPYVFTKIADNETPRPDGVGNFYFGFPLVTPALDGNTITFQDLASNDNSLWAANGTGGELVKLVDFRTAVPGGVGAFSRFNDQTGRAKDGLLFFEGLDSVPVDPGHHLHGGIYTVPVGGGAVSKVVDYNTIAPNANGGPFVAANGGNMLTGGFDDGDFDYEAGVIAFHGITDFGGDGIYSVHADGTALTRLADKNTEGTPPPFPVGQYFTAALHNHTAVFHGGTVFGPYGLFASPETGGLSSPTLLATPYTALPGSQSGDSLTNYFTGFSRFDHVTGKYVFAGNAGTRLNGLYTLPADALSSGTISKVVDNHTALPGSSVPASYFDGTQFSADGGQVAFVTATNESAGQVGALYVANADGTISRVLGVGDTLDGISIAGITLGAHALSGGRIVFGAGSLFQGHNGLPRYGAIFVATPASQADDLSVSLADSTAQASVGQNVNFTLTVVNKGPAAGAGVVLSDMLPAGLTFLSATGGAVATGSAVSLNVGALAPGASASFDVTARVDAAGSLVNTATATGAVADADPTNNTAQATVAAVSLPTVTLTAAVPSVTAGSGAQGQFLLTISPPQAKNVIVNFKIKGDAENGTDYALIQNFKKIKKNKASKPINIVPLGAGAGPGVKRTVKLALAPGDGYVVGTTAKVKVKIIGQ